MTRLGRGGRAFEDIRKAEEDDDVDANDVVNGVDWNGWHLSCYLTTTTFTTTTGT